MAVRASLLALEGSPNAKNMKNNLMFSTLSAVFSGLMPRDALAQLPDDSQRSYEYSDPFSEPFGLEYTGDYA